AVAEYREALRLRPNFPEAHFALGNAENDQGKLAEAVEEYRKGLRLRPGDPAAHINLGAALNKQGKPAEAEAECREALRLEPGHELGSTRPGWPYPSGQWVRQADQLVALDVRLPEILKGAAQPADAAERIGLAKLCQEYKKLYAAAERFYAEAFAAEPKLADDLRTQDRYNAACAAALAGCGQGEDAGNLNDQKRTRLRGQALAGLRADLTAWGQLLEE